MTSYHEHCISASHQSTQILPQQRASCSQPIKPSSRKIARKPKPSKPSRRSARLQRISTALHLDKNISTATSPAIKPVEARTTRSRPSRKRNTEKIFSPAHAKTRAQLGGGSRREREVSADGRTRVERLLSPSTASSHRETLSANIARKPDRHIPSDVHSTTTLNSARERTISNDQIEINGRPAKRQRTDRSTGSVNSEIAVQTPAIGKGTRPSTFYDNPITYWTIYCKWPSNFADYPIMSSSTTNTGKRQRQSDASQSGGRSYSQDRKAGEVPEQYTPQYENYIRDKGLNMNILEGEELVSAESLRMCIELQKITRTVIKPSIIPTGEFRKIINIYQNRNEAIVQRDITPIFLPPIALLLFGGDQFVEHLCDEVQAPWYGRCILAGPRPQPDLAIGLAQSSFTTTEIDKLNRFKSFTNWTQVTDYMFFPFLMCEVKCGVEGLDFADRQNMHSCSVAVRAIFRLVQEADKYRTHQEIPELNGQILVYSISHDQKSARVYGHFAVYEDSRWSYYRHIIKTFLILESERDLLGVHNFVRNVLESYTPIHLKRLREALSALPEPTALSFSASALSVNEYSHELPDTDMRADDAGDSVFRKPDVPLKARQQGEMSGMRQQIDTLLQQLREKEEKAQQQIDQLLKQMEQQREDSQRQMEQQRRDSQRQMDRILQRLEGEGDGKE